MAHATVSEFRAGLARWIDLVKAPNEYVLITSHGREVAALISAENMKVLWNAQDERRVGPINPASGRPFGSAWVSANFQGHYERELDPQSHLHPSREEAPWLGRAFVWPRPEGAEERPGVTGAAVAPEAAPAPRGRWWRVWRR